MPIPVTSSSLVVFFFCTTNREGFSPKVLRQPPVWKPTGGGIWLKAQWSGSLVVPNDIKTTGAGETGGKCGKCGNMNKVILGLNTDFRASSVFLIAIKHIIFVNFNINKYCVVTWTCCRSCQPYVKSMNAYLSFLAPQRPRWRTTTWIRRFFHLVEHKTSCFPSDQKGSIRCGPLPGCQW